MSCKSNGILQANDIAIFKNTEVWDLAKAMSNHELDQMKSILDDGETNIDTQEPLYGMTLFGWAIDNDYDAEALLLSDYNANPFITDFDGESAIIYAAKKHYMKYQEDSIPSHYLKLCLSSIENSQMNRDTINLHLNKALLVATGNDILSTKLLIKQGANPNFHSSDSTESPLCNAIIAKRFHIVQYLLDSTGAIANSYVKQPFSFGSNLISIREYLELSKPSNSSDQAIKNDLLMRYFSN